MALVSFEDLLRAPPRGKVYVADTSFLVSASKAQHREERLCSDVKSALINGGCGISYNVNVKSEILHFLRLFLIQDAIDRRKIRPHQEFLRVWENSRPHEKLKRVTDAGYVEVFRKVFGSAGQTLKKELEGVLFGCAYMDSSRLSPRPSWDQLYQIMATYGLDSSDAMIINFAVSQRTFSGLLTRDGDFRFCSDIPDFDIVVPKRVLNQQTVQKWSS